MSIRSAPRCSCTRASRRVEQLFSLRFDRYRLPDGSRYFAPEGPPQIPATLAPYITGLGDLSDHPLPSEDIPSSGLTPSVTAKAYDISAALERRISADRARRSRSRLHEGAVNPADLGRFETGRRPVPQIEVKQVDGGSRYSAAQGSDPEVDLDLQVASASSPRRTSSTTRARTAPAASPHLGFGHSLADIYNQIEQDGLAHVVTTSYGLCDERSRLSAPETSS